MKNIEQIEYPIMCLGRVQILVGTKLLNGLSVGMFGGCVKCFNGHKSFYTVR